MRLFLAVGLAVASAPAQAAELAVAPADSLVTVPARNRGYYDLIVPTVLVRADAGEMLQQVRFTIELSRKGQVVQTRFVSTEDVAGETAGLAEAGIAAFVNAQTLSTSGLAGLFGKPTALATSGEIDSGQAAGTFGNAFVSKGPVDRVRIIAEARSASGAPVRVEKSLLVAEHKSAITYRAPVSGNWLMTAMPGLRSHHRFNPPSEFALDFFRADAEGRIWHEDPMPAANFYGFGADVLAAADGTVVAVIDGEVQNRDILVRKPGEAADVAGRRMQSFNMGRYAEDFPRATAGNLVVIRHEAGSSVEYSAYGHLKSGIPVQPGQIVKQGDKIGSVGDTGDSAAAHLHFQVNAGPDPFTSKSLPVRLTNIQDPSGIDDVLETISVKP